MATRKQPQTFNGLPQVDYEGYDEWIKQQTAGYNGQQAFQGAKQQAEANGILPRGGDTIGNGVFGTLKDSADAGFFNSLAGTARFAGEFSPFGGDMLNKAADKLEERAAYNTPTEELTGANYIASAIGNAIGSGSAAMVEAAAVAGIAKAMGIGALGSATMGVISKVPKLNKIKTAAEVMWQKPFGKMLIGQVAGSPFEATAEAGNLISEMRQEGFDDDDIRQAALTSAAYNTGWLTVANMLEAGVSAKLAKGFAKSIGKGSVADYMTKPLALKEMAKRAGQTAAFGGVSEAGEEFGQGLIGNYAKGEDFDYDTAAEGALQGFIGGAFLGGAGTGTNFLFGDNSRNFKVDGKHFEAGNTYELNGQKVRDYQINGKDVSAAQFFIEAGLQDVDGNTYGLDRKGYSKSIVQQEIDALDENDAEQAKQKATLRRILESDDTERIFQAAKAIFKKGPHFETTQQSEPENNKKTTQEELVDEVAQVEQPYGEALDIPYMDVNGPVWGERIAEQQNIDKNNAYGNIYANQVAGETPNAAQNIKNNNTGDVQGKAQVPFMPDEYYSEQVDKLAGKQKDKTNSVVDERGNDLIGDSSKLENLIRRAYYGDSNANWKLYEMGIDENYIKLIEDKIRTEEEERKERWEENRLNKEVSTDINKDTKATNDTESQVNIIAQSGQSSPPVEMTASTTTSNNGQFVIPGTSPKTPTVKNSDNKNVAENNTPKPIASIETEIVKAQPIPKTKTVNKQQEALKMLMEKERELKAKVEKGEISTKEAKRQFTRAIQENGEFITQAVADTRRKKFSDDVEKVVQSKKNNAEKAEPIAKNTTTSAAQPIQSEPAQQVERVAEKSEIKQPISKEKNINTKENDNNVPLTTEDKVSRTPFAQNTTIESTKPIVNDNTKLKEETAPVSDSEKQQTDEDRKTNREAILRFYNQILSMIKDSGIDIITEPKAVFNYFMNDVGKNPLIHDVKLEDGRISFYIGKNSHKYYWHGSFNQQTNEMVVPALNGNVVNDIAIFNAPIHEFSHLWVAVLRDRNNALWEQGKKLLARTEKSLMNDPASQLVREQIKQVRHKASLTGSPYKKLLKNGEYTDAFWDEVLAHCLGNEKFVTFEMINLAKNRNEKEMVSAWKQWIAKAWKEIKHAFRLRGSEIKNVTLSQFLKMPLSDLVNGQKIGEMNSRFGSNVKLKNTAPKTLEKSPQNIIEDGIADFKKNGFTDNDKYSNAKGQLNRKITLWEKEEVITKEEADKLHDYVNREMPKALSENAKKELKAEQQVYFNAGDKIVDNYANKQISWEEAEEQINALVNSAKEAGITGKNLEVLRKYTWAKYYQNQTANDKSAKEAKVAEYKANKNKNNNVSDNTDNINQSQSSNNVARQILSGMPNNTVKQTSKSVSSPYFQKIVNDIFDIVKKYNNNEYGNDYKKAKADAMDVLNAAAQDQLIDGSEYDRILARINATFISNDQKRAEVENGMGFGANSVIDRLGLQRTKSSQQENEGVVKAEKITDINNNISNKPTAADVVKDIIASMPIVQQEEQNIQEENKPIEKTKETFSKEEISSAPKDDYQRWKRLNEYINNKAQSLKDSSKNMVYSLVTKDPELYYVKDKKGESYYANYKTGDDQNYIQPISKQEAELLEYATGNIIEERTQQVAGKIDAPIKKDTKPSVGPKKNVSLPKEDDDGYGLDFGDYFAEQNQQGGNVENTGFPVDDVYTALTTLKDETGKTLESVVRSQVEKDLPNLKEGKPKNKGAVSFLKDIDIFDVEQDSDIDDFYDYDKSIDEKNLGNMAYEYYKFLVGKYANNYEQYIQEEVDTNENIRHSFSEADNNNIDIFEELNRVGVNSNAIDTNSVIEKKRNNTEFKQTNNSTPLEQRAKITVTNRGKSFTEHINDIKANPINYIKTKLKELFIKLYKDWVDKNFNFELLDRETARRLKRNIREAEKIYHQMHGINYKSAGMTEGLLFGGEDEFKAMNMRLTNVKMQHKNGTMAQVMSNISEDKLDSKSKEFMKKYGFKDSVEALGEALTWRRFRELYRIHDEAYAEWERNGKKGEKPKMVAVPNNLTSQELDVLIKNIPEQFNKACKDYYALNENILCILEDAGVISKSLHDTLKKHVDYCPLQRDFSDTAGLEDYLSGFNSGGSGAANVSNSIIRHMTKEGSKRNVINPLETTVMVTQMATRRAERNKAAQKFVSLINLKDTNGKSLMSDVVQSRWHWATTDAERKVGEKVVNADGKVVGYIVKNTPRMQDSTFSVMENGIKKTYWCNPMYYEDLVGENSDSSGMIWDIMAKAAKVLRFTATKSPSFIIRNGIRDTFTAAISSGNIGFIPIKGSADGFLMLSRDKQNLTPEQKRLLAMFRVSGISTGTVSKEGNAIYKSLQEMTRSKDKNVDIANPLETVKEALRVYNKFNDNIELAPRLKLLELKLADNEKKLITDRALTEQEIKQGYFASELEAVDDAIRMALRGTTDFGRMGVRGQKVNQIVPFFNATIQGIDILANNLANPKSRNATIYNIAKYIVVPSIALWAMNHDKDWYKESDRQLRYSNWIISDNLRVPVPQDAGTLFHGLTTALLDRLSDNDPNAVKEWGLAMRGVFSPNYVPAAIGPILEWQANYSFFTHRNIVSQRLQKLPDELQYDTSTPYILRDIGKATGASPKKLQALYRGYLSTLGDYALRAFDVPYGALSGAENDGAAKTIGEMIGVRDFNLTENLKTRYSNDFYQMLDEAKKQHQGYGKKGKPSKELQALNAASRVVSKHMQSIRAIETDKRYTPEQRRELIDKERAKMNSVFKKAVDKYGPRLL